MIKLLCIDASGQAREYLREGTSYTLRERLPSCCDRQQPWVTLEEVTSPPADGSAPTICSYCGTNFERLTHIAFWACRFIELNNPTATSLEEEKEKELIS